VTNILMFILSFRSVVYNLYVRRVGLYESLMCDLRATSQHMGERLNEIKWAK